MKTIEVVKAYNTLKDLKLAEIEDETMLKIWKNLKVFRKVSNDFEAAKKDIITTLQDDTFKKMQERLKKCIELDRKQKQEGYVLTHAEAVDYREVIEFFQKNDEKALKGIKILEDETVSVIITKISADEMLKVLKKNNKAFSDMDNLEIILA